MNVTAQVMHALRRDLFPPHKYVWATEVGVPSNDTLRRMDAVAINARAAPFLLDGFEVKVSRADWLNDRDGTKSEPARQAVDRFWYVFGSASIYKRDEVPEACGIVELVDGRAKAVRQPAAPAGDATHYCRSLLSTILTRTLREETSNFVSQLERDAEARGYRKGMSAAKRRSPVTQTGGVARPKYNPARFDFDDGIPLDLP